MILSHHARVLQLFGYLAHLQKIFSKICDFPFSSFDFSTGIILKQLNKIKNLNIFSVFFTFILLCCFCCFFSRCASLLWSLLSYPVVHPTAAPQGLQRRPGTARFHFPPTRARWRKTLTPTRCIGITAPGRHHGETQRGDTTGKQNGETKRETKWENESGKK